MTNDLLPNNATPQERALALATGRVSDVPVLVRESWNPDTCPVDLLPWLAWAFSVDIWDATWTEEQKRGAIKSSVLVHRHKGTPAAMKAALDGLGYGLELQEWYQLTPQGDPYTFGLIVDVSESGIASSAEFDRIEQVAISAKNVRSHMTFINIHGTVSGQIYAGGVAICGETVSINSGD